VFTNTLIGKMLGKYRIVSEIGRGGMAVVYKAEQVGLGRFVALKVLLPSFTGEDASVDRLRREAQAAAGLDHPNIVSIYEVGEVDGLHYIAMKFVEGRPLDVILKEDNLLPTERVIRILAQIASALDYAHRRHLVHRDIKPSNIIVGTDDHVTLTDFGLVKSVGSVTLTSSGMLVGTPAYMSPEQARGMEIDYRADIYSLGVIAFELLAGRPPFEGNPLSIILAHASQDPPPLRSLRPSLPAGAEAATARALAKEAQDRFATAGAFVAALRQALTRPAKTMPTRLPLARPTPAAGATRARLPFLWPLILALLLSLALFGAFGSIQGRRAWTYLTSDAGAPAAVAIFPSATAVIATQTPLVSIPSPTPRPSATPTASATVSPVLPSPVATVMSMPAATATAVPPASPTPTPTVTATSSPLPTPTRTAFVQPASIELLAPAADQSFRRMETPVLHWSRSAPLAADERFVVVIDRVAPAPNSGVWHDYHITTETTLVAPTYLAQTTADGRFEWYVQVMRAPRIEAGALYGVVVGSASPRRAFVWEPIPTSTPGRSEKPKPTPTRDA